MHRLAQVLGDAHGAGAIGVRQHHDELLATAAAGEVAAAQLAAHEGAQCREDLVAALVAEGVVDLLEVIEVQQDRRHRRQRAAGLGEQALGTLGFGGLLLGRQVSASARRRRTVTASEIPPSTRLASRISLTGTSAADFSSSTRASSRNRWYPRFALTKCWISRSRSGDRTMSGVLCPAPRASTAICAMLSQPSSATSWRSTLASPRGCPPTASAPGPGRRRV